MTSSLQALGPSWLDPQNLGTLGTVAPWVAAAIIFAETGLLLGFFLPGDTLLFTVGLLVGTGVIGFPLWAAVLLLAAAAFVGNVVGYEIGRAAGPAIFRREDSAVFKHENVERAEVFFAEHGPVAVVLARFIPIVRTFITVVAGVARMNRARYLTYSGIGAVVWAGGVTLLGYYLGSVAFVRDHVSTIFAIVEVALVGVVLLSVMPIILDALRRRRRRRAEQEGTAPSAPAPSTEVPPAGAGRHADRQG